MYKPTHPGSLLREYLTGVSVTHAAQCLGVSRVNLSRLLNGRGALTADMDLRLSRALGTKAGHFYSMQCDYDMAMAALRFRGTMTRITPGA